MGEVYAASPELDENAPFGLSPQAGRPMTRTLSAFTGLARVQE